MIANCGSDENGKYTGGKAGDQTGKEWVIKPFYSYPWTHVLRYKDFTVGNMLAVLAASSAQNDHIGYNQGDRLSFWKCLYDCDYNPALITKDCNADCSSGVAAIVKATGFLMDESVLKGVSNTLTTRNLRSTLEKLGFLVITDKNVLSGNGLLVGDILLAEGKHTAINLSKTIGLNSEVVNTYPNVKAAKSKNASYAGTYAVKTACDFMADDGGAVIGKLNMGDTLKCYGYYTGNSLYVQYGNKVGYVSKENLVKVR